MGVPTLFADLLRKNPRSVIPTPPSSTQFLFIDFNSIIYDILHQLTHTVDTSTSPVEFTRRLIVAVGDKLRHMIELIHPTDMIYIAMDGVPPRAKMVQQRARRYKGIKDRARNHQILRTHDQPLPYDWDTTQISPGTIFMRDMADHLRTRILSGDYIAAASSTELQIILSDTTVPGEGEHKFLPLLKRFQGRTSVIYSPDGDMIILAISTNMPNLTIMRRSDQPPDEFTYMNIDTVRGDYERQMARDNFNPSSYMMDFVLLSCLAGNDFVIPPPYLKIKYRDLGMGLEFLLSTYQEIHQEQPDEYLVTSTLDINMVLFTRIVEKVARNERGFYQSLQRKRDQVRRRRHDQRLEDMRKELPAWQYEQQLYDHVEYYSPYHPEHGDYNQEFDRIDYFGADYRRQYYETFFNDSAETLINQICHQYLLTIWFNLRYYFGELPSWRFYYRYDAPPLYEDLLRYLERTPTPIFQIEEEGPMDPFLQLMLILPPSSATALLPRSMTEPMTRELRDYYPTEFRYNVLLGMKGIYSEPILPDIELDRVLPIYERAKRGLSQVDRDRNKLSTKPQYFSHV